MKFSLKVVGTGSKGNCYLLTVGNEIIVIEAGLPFTKIKKALNFNLSNVVGVLISHEHGDHSKSVKDFQKFGKEIYSTCGTARALKLEYFNQLEYLKPKKVGENFKVIPIKSFHDAKEPCCFLIEFGYKRLAFITDTGDIKTRLNNVDYWLIECNYSNEMLKKSKLDISLKKRIQDTHLSVDSCKTILNGCGVEKSELVMLIHGSDNHSDNDEFLNKLPYAIIASEGLELNY